MQEIQKTERETEMTTKSKEIIRRAMQNAKGDDLVRCEWAFQHCSEREMEEQYGASEQTRHQILDGYKKHRTEWEQANNELEELLK